MTREDDVPLPLAIVLAVLPVAILTGWLVYRNWGRYHLYRRWVRRLPTCSEDRRVKKP